MRNLFLASLALCGIVTAGAVPVTVFTTDFNSGVPSQITGVTSTEGVQGFSSVGFGGNFLRNDTLGFSTVLTLTGLAPHTSVDINFLLAVIDSWDGVTAGFSPDFFNIKIDGNTLAQSFDNFNPLDQIILPGTTQLAYNVGLGFATAWPEAAYDYGTTPALTIPHVSSTLTVEFFSSGAGFQGGGDESWALENLNVVIDAIPGVPDAGTTALFLALSMLGLLRFRTRLTS